MHDGIGAERSDRGDRRFMELADFIAQWSKDPSTKVGAVIVDPRNKRIVSTGFNGFPYGVEDSADRLEDKSVKYEMIVHAETNALMFAGEQANGCVLYVTPLPPCARCAVLIIQSGITRVVSPTHTLKRMLVSRHNSQLFTRSSSAISYWSAASMCRPVA